MVEKAPHARIMAALRIMKQSPFMSLGGDLQGLYLFWSQNIQNHCRCIHDNSYNCWVEVAAPGGTVERVRIQVAMVQWYSNLCK